MELSSCKQEVNNVSVVVGENIDRRAKRREILEKQYQVFANKPFFVRVCVG